MRSRPRKLLLFLPLVGLLLLFGCDLFGEDGPEDPPPVETLFTVDVNGEPWNTRGGLAGLNCIDGLFSMSISGGKQHEELWPYQESLSLSIVDYDGPRPHSLVEKIHDEDQHIVSGSAYWEKDGDAIITSYSPTSDPEANQIMITRYDPDGGSTEESRRASQSKVIETAGIIEGTFRTVLVIDPAQAVTEPGEPPRRQPDTLRFTNGRFRVGALDGPDRESFRECGLLPSN